MPSDQEILVATRIKLHTEENGTRFHTFAASRNDRFGSDSEEMRFYLYV